MEPEPCIPDYGGAWIGGIVAALDDPAAAGWLPEPARTARAHVLLVLDGLGWNALRDRAAELPTLAAMVGGPITTVVPSTTAAALTSISTGASPAEHGLLGYRIRVGGRALNVLRWQTGKQESVPDPAEVQPIAPFGGRPVTVVTRAEFAKTGFTAAHLRDADFRGWRTISALLERVRHSVRDGARLTYAYDDDVDRVAHEYGTASDVYATQLVLTDRLVGDLLDRLPAEVTLLVTADHGQVDVGPAGAVSLEAVRRMVAGYSGEGRFRWLHGRTGAAADLATACREAYGDRAWVRPREQVFDDGWLGGGGSLTVRSRVGDVLLAAHAPVMFVDPGQQKEPKMIAQHGSLTPAEVLVPLVAARGRA